MLLYSACLSWALVLTWVSPYVQDKKEGLGNRLSRYDIHADGALSPSITVIARLNIFRATGFAMFLLRELIPKYKYVSFEFLMKVIVALILNE